MKMTFIAAIFIAAGSEADTLAGFFRYAASRMPHWEGVVEISEKGTPPPELRRHGGRLLMILQEAVGNALRHGGAEHVRVRLASDGASFKMTIRDDGCGFTPGDGQADRRHRPRLRTRVSDVGLPRVSCLTLHSPFQVLPPLRGYSRPALFLQTSMTAGIGGGCGRRAQIVRAGRFFIDPARGKMV